MAAWTPLPHNGVKLNYARLGILNAVAAADPASLPPDVLAARQVVQRMEDENRDAAAARRAAVLATPTHYTADPLARSTLCGRRTDSLGDEAFGWVGRDNEFIATARVRVGNVICPQCDAAAGP